MAGFLPRELFKKNHHCGGASRGKRNFSFLPPSPNPNRATATERELAMQRWLKKYQYEIPDFYDPNAGGKIESKN